MMASGSSGAQAVRRPGQCSVVRGAALRAVLERHSSVLFDCDGVLWNGEAPVPRAPEAVRALTARGKQVFFVTNNCTRPRANYVTKFSRLGFSDVTEEQIFSSAYCSAQYLRDVAKLQEGKVFVIGCQAIRAELQEAGVAVVEEVEPGSQTGTIYDYPLDPDVRAVLVGYDEHFNFIKLAKACCYLQNPDCLFLATDPDPWHPLRGGRIAPGSGSLTAAVETASGRRATVVGKPGGFMFDCIAAQLAAAAGGGSSEPAEERRSLMVGDRLETDILFGRRRGLTTVLTLSGVSTLSEALQRRDEEEERREAGGGAEPEEEGLAPDYVVDSVADFIEAYREEEEEEEEKEG